jgi:hypothetical protein
MIYWTKATLSVDIVRAEFNLSGLPDIAVHISGFYPSHENQIYGPHCKGGY